MAKSKAHKLSLLALLLAGPVLYPHTAYAQLEALGAGVSTAFVVNQVGDELRSTISEATASGNFLVMRAGQEALYVLDGFKAANRDLMDTAFAKIGTERQTLLNQVRETSRMLEEGRVDTLSKLESMTDQLDTLVRESTFKKHPTIFRYRGSLVVPGDTQPVRLRVKGYRLTEGKPYLIFRNKRYNAITEANDLRFDLPRALFAAKDGEIVSENASLVLWKEPNWFWQDPTEVRTSLNIVTLPSKLATINVGYLTKVATPQEQAFEEEVNYNSSSRRWNCRPYAYSPATAERRFDVSRSSVTDTQQGNGRGQLRDVSVRDVGISFSICAYRGYHRNNGYRHARVRYVETWVTYEPKDERKSAAITWKQGARIAVPTPIENLSIFVKDFSGNQTPVASTGGIVGRFVNVTYDREGRSIIVTPVVPSDIQAL